MEVLISFAILVTTGSLLSGFLYRGSITQKARNENYGQELCKIILLTETPNTEKQSMDSLFLHNDGNGNLWEVFIKQTIEGDEICYEAQPVRNKVDSTKALYYCHYTTSVMKLWGQSAL